MRFLLLLTVVNVCFTLLVRSENFKGLLQDLVNLDFNKIKISADCENGLIAIRNGLRDREIWALKALDASSYLASDFVWGNNIASGAPRSCDLVSTPVPIKMGPNYVPKSFANLTQIASPFPVTYRVLHARHHSRLQFDMQMLEKTVLDFGFCMPVACSNVDSEKLFRTLLSDEKFLNRTLLDREPEFLETRLLELSQDFFQNPFVRGFISILCIHLCLILLDIILKGFKRLFLNRSQDLKKHDESFWEKVLSCFSISENVKAVLFTSDTHKSIPVVDGLRAISMFFFIIVHFMIFGISGVTNFPQILIFTEVLWFQPLIATHFFVDTFFVIGATLMSHTFFEYAKTNEIKNKFGVFLKKLIKRYLRLTPTYVVHLLLVVTITKLIKSLSPFYLMDDNETKCKDSWWMNFLYINNFQGFNETCLMWSYYLATDFQLGTIATILLLIIVTWKKFGLALSGVILTIAIAVCGYFGYTIPFTPTLYHMNLTGKYLYTPFWCRLSPYFSGLFAGWFLSYKDRTLGLSRKLIVIGWMVAGAVLLSVELSQMNSVISPTAGLFYAAFVRFAWGMGISWIIVACTTGHGGLVGKFLSSPFFFPFSRLSYSAYLVNPVWILASVMFNDTPIHLDYGLSLVITVGFVVTVYMFAFVFSILFESPFLRLIKLM